MKSPTRVIVVSNRLPVTVECKESGISTRPSSGGLITALRPILRNTQNCCWVGWPGSGLAPDNQRVLLSKDWQSSCSMHPVHLTEHEISCFYHGCANEIIWPLFHDLQSHCKFDPEYWETYKDVTEKYADVVEQVAVRGDFVWVHDYHLMLMADALRARDLRLNIAYFHHIPFPQADIFEKLPWRNEIIRGLLQFSAVGLQTARDLHNFIECVRRCLRDVDVEQAGSRLLVRSGNLCTTVGAFPISIDFHEFESCAHSSEVAVRAREIRSGIAAEKLVLGVDRLDYTKGIAERLLGFRALLKSYPESQGKVTLIQLVVPSREEIPGYKELKHSIERLVTDINGEFGTTSWTPVVYMHRCLARSELVALYRSADVALITPLKDGMNLVAKEYCASRPDSDGVLILSEFAGAAAELGSGALLVNPYDTEGVAASIRRALTMPVSERRVRMTGMRETIRSFDVFRWCKSFCGRVIAERSAVGNMVIEMPKAAANLAAYG